nr:pilus assembly protein CpaE [Propionibacterium sp.]
MLTRELAQRLREAGLPWTPASGDRFVIPDRDLDDDLFVISEMTIEVHEILGRRIIRFNGTTEWALDSISADLVLWLPREDQLRDALGDRFATLERTPFGFVVTCADGSRHADVDAERAYARALLEVLTRPD